jgi:hypothetical protein
VRRREILPGWKVRFIEDLLEQTEGWVEYKQTPFYDHVPGQQHIVQALIQKSHQANGKKKKTRRSF